MSKIWEVDYKGHQIMVENHVRGERLYVDGQLQDELVGIALRARLYGKIKSGEGIGENIKVSLGGFFSVSCKIFIDEFLVFES